MILNLPKLFNMIHFLVQSMNRSFINKEELVHKIIWNQCDMIDRSKQIIIDFQGKYNFLSMEVSFEPKSSFVLFSEDVEEQLNLLLELVPDWISEKKVGGDLLLT